MADIRIKISSRVRIIDLVHICKRNFRERILIIFNLYALKCSKLQMEFSFDWFIFMPLSWTDKILYLYFHILIIVVYFYNQTGVLHGSVYTLVFTKSSIFSQRKTGTCSNKRCKHNTHSLSERNSLKRGKEEKSWTSCKVWAFTPFPPQNNHVRLFWGRVAILLREQTFSPSNNTYVDYFDQVEV